MDESTARAIYGHGVVATSLKCRQCGYELRGLHAAGLCPECGLSIWASVQHAADPDGARLPRLRNPKAVGSALVWLISASFIASVLWGIRTTFALLDRIDPTSGSRFSDWTPPQPRLIASLLVLSGLWSVWRLKPPRHVREPGVVRRDLRLLLVGLIFSGLAMLELTFASVLHRRLPPSWESWYTLAISLSLVFFVFISLLGLQGILRLIGQRSRQYRTARDSRQNVHALMAVLAFIGLGLVLRQVPYKSWPSDGFWTSLSMVMVAISYAMLVVGMAYLLMNTLWIRRALQQEPPTIDQLLLPPNSAVPADSALPELDREADQAQTMARDSDNAASHAARQAR